MALYLSIAVFVMQLMSQYGVFFQMPEHLRKMGDKMETLDESINENAVRHVEVKKDIAALQSEIKSSQEEHTRMWTKILDNAKELAVIGLMAKDMEAIKFSYQQMIADDKGQWESIRRLQIRVLTLEQSVFKGSREYLKEDANHNE